MLVPTSHSPPELEQELSIAQFNAELLFPKKYWLGRIERFQRKFLVWKTILQTLLRRSFDWVSELTLTHHCYGSDGCRDGLNIPGSFRRLHALN